MSRTASARHLLAAVAILAVSCGRGDRITTPSTARAGGNPPRVALDAVGPGDCGANCVLFNTIAPLWSALAYPDSVNLPVEIADVSLLPASDDSVLLTVTGDTASIAALGDAEIVDVTDGTTEVRTSLQALRSPRAVWSFTSTNPTTLHITLNRALASPPSGSIALTMATTAAVVSAVRPWIAPSEVAAISAQRKRLPGSRTADLAPTQCTSAAVSRSGNFCGVNVSFSSVAPADAFMGFGATFQSNPGHGASHTITISFDQPVLSVAVTVYDPTFDGNSMTAFDAQGQLIGSVPFPGNGRPGVLSIQSGFLIGSISKLVLTPGAADFVAYSMNVAFGGGLTLSLVPASRATLPPSYKKFVSNICNVSARASSLSYQARIASSRGATLANRSIALSVAAVKFSGGHQHDTDRPQGAFDSLGTTTTTVTSDASGTAQFTFFPPEIGGKYVITASTVGARDTTDTVTVGYDLSPIQPTTHELLVGQTTTHPNSNNATPGMAAALATLAESLFNLPGHPTININDESLPTGGLFDLDSNWVPSHCSHRRGTDADIRDRILTADQVEYLKIIWPKIPGGRSWLKEGNHIHLNGTP